MKGRIFIYEPDSTDPYHDPIGDRFKSFSENVLLPYFKDDKILKKKYLDQEDNVFRFPIGYFYYSIGQRRFGVSEEFKKNHPEHARIIWNMIKEEFGS